MSLVGGVGNVTVRNMSRHEMRSVEKKLGGGCFRLSTGALANPCRDEWNDWKRLIAILLNCNDSIYLAFAL